MPEVSLAASELDPHLFAPDVRDFEDGVRAEVAEHDAESNRKFSHLLRYLEQGRQQRC